jgi:hypothetical protein
MVVELLDTQAEEIFWIWFTKRNRRGTNTSIGETVILSIEERNLLR